MRRLADGGDKGAVPGFFHYFSLAQPTALVANRARLLAADLGALWGRLRYIDQTTGAQVGTRF
jgi:hypothetical protein